MVKLCNTFILLILLFPLSLLKEEEEIIDLTPYHKDIIKENDGILTIAILFTTDIHGYFFPRVINNSHI